MKRKTSLRPRTSRDCVAATLRPVRRAISAMSCHRLRATAVQIRERCGEQILRPGLKRQAVSPKVGVAPTRRSRSDGADRRGSGCQRFGFPSVAEEGADVGRRRGTACDVQPRADSMANAGPHSSVTTCTRPGTAGQGGRARGEGAGRVPRRPGHRRGHRIRSSSLRSI